MKNKRKPLPYTVQFCKKRFPFSIFFFKSVNKQLLSANDHRLVLFTPSFSVISNRPLDNYDVPPCLEKLIFSSCKDHAVQLGKAANTAFIFSRVNSFFLLFLLLNMYAYKDLLNQLKNYQLKPYVTCSIQNSVTKFDVMLKAII